MLSCTSCDVQEGEVITCPNCGKRYCAACYLAHAKKEKNNIFADLAAASFRTAEFDERGIGQLKDTEGTPTPAATTPKIYRGGGGSPDEPPEGAGAPNRPRINASA